MSICVHIIMHNSYAVNTKHSTPRSTCITVYRKTCDKGQLIVSRYGIKFN